MGVNIIAASSDSEEDTTVVAKDLGFPLAYGVNRKQADSIGAWWEERRDHIQPSEFILSKSGKVMMSTYSNSPVGRMDAAEVMTLIEYLISMRK